MPRQNETLTPTYLGCVTRAIGRPALMFSNGFLVQDDQDPAQCGWYALTHPNVIQTHITLDLATAILMGGGAPAMLDSACRPVLNQYLNEAHQALMGNVVAVPADRTHYVMLDIDDVDRPQLASIYLFTGRFVHANDPHMPAAWRLPNALQALGPLDATGQPTRPVRHMTAPGVTRFA